MDIRIRMVGTHTRRKRTLDMQGMRMITLGIVTILPIVKLIIHIPILITMRTTPIRMTMTIIHIHMIRRPILIRMPRKSTHTLMGTTTRTEMIRRMDMITLMAMITRTDMTTRMTMIIHIRTRTVMIIRPGLNMTDISPSYARG